ncbi:hypothetical protein C41B8_11253 [Salinisphaera hydrothermalis C41B8]|uniref:Uncharacterized protein n=1 Tax=Salinisphaera hydrothermalis (strain C41B8) TaxID=1304275 RepID=A0A084IKC8_SALHC|nr:hypothetical protein C41B8_11253 [Salinisphaera hydrothermalis C41B8]
MWPRGAYLDPRPARNGTGHDGAIVVALHVARANHAARCRRPARRSTDGRPSARDAWRDVSPTTYPIPRPMFSHADRDDRIACNLSTNAGRSRKMAALR